MVELKRDLKELGPRPECVRNVRNWSDFGRKIGFELDMDGRYSQHGHLLIRAVRREKNLVGMYRKQFPEAAKQYDDEFSIYSYKRKSDDPPALDNVTSNSQCSATAPLHGTCQVPACGYFPTEAANAYPHQFAYAPISYHYTTKPLLDHWWVPCKRARSVPPSSPPTEWIGNVPRFQ